MAAQALLLANEVSDNITDLLFYTPSCLQESPLVLEQLIVGVLLFVPCLALLPTTFIWYLASSLLLSGWPFLLRSALYNLSWAVRWNLALLLMWRYIDPTAFPGGV